MGRDDMSNAPNLMPAFVGMLGVILLAACNEPAPPAPTIATVTTTAPVEKPPTREVIDPLPSTEAVAKNAIAGMTAPERAIFRGAAPDANLPASVRAYPDFTTRLYPPSNALRLKVTAFLEDEAWTRRSEHPTDGITLVIKTIGAGDAVINTVEITVDPSRDAALQGKPAELIAEIPAEAVRLDFSVLQRVNGAFDSTTVVLSYE